MTVEVWFKARLTFADAKAVSAAKAELKDEGCVGHADNLLTDEHLKWKGLTLEVQERWSMPYSCFEISSSVLNTYARHAKTGDALAINLEDGCGERYPAGDDGVELEEDEVDALREQAGWKHDA
jgi:hypothetical protein